MRANDSPPTTSLEQQAAFFHTFGALKVPGLFADDIDRICEGFEEMFRDFPAEEGQRWVYDRNGDSYDRDPDSHEWVLVGTKK